MTEIPNQDHDTFFVLRDCRTLFLRRLVEVARHAGIGAQAVLDAFAEELGGAFDELVASKQQDGFEQTNGLTASRISLVGNDDLEIQIRIGNLVARLKENERIDFWHVQLRFMTLLNRPYLTAETNPAGLEPISCGLWALCHASDGSLDQKFDRLDRLEEQLALELPAIYAELDGLLQQFRVEAASVRPVQRPTRPSSTPGERFAAETVAPREENALASLRQQVQGSASLSGNAVVAGDLAFPPIQNPLLNASALTLINQVLAKMSARPFGKERVLAPHFDTRLEIGPF